MAAHRQCGACTVHVTGWRRRSCFLPVGRSDEGWFTIAVLGERACTVQQAWIEPRLPQCGYCIRGY
jgi:isoquinoline 1-oxidoreductase alpha subunit